MKLKSIIIILPLSLLLLLSVSCTKIQTEGQISFKDVSSIEITLDKNNKVVYTSNKNDREIEEFIKALNQGKSYGSIEKITPDTSFKINFKDGTGMETVQ